MPAGQRRASIVASARALLISTGITFTTRQVAEAAGIAEGTVFRHFASKDAIVQAVIEDAFDPSGLCAGIDALPRDMDLTQRVERSLELMTSQLGTITEVLAALHPHRLRNPNHPDSHHGDTARHGRPGTRTADHPEDPHDRSHNQIRNWYSSVTAALDRLLEPYAGRLRVPAEQACALMLSTVTMNLRPIAVSPHKFSPAELTDILLNGIALSEPQPASTTSPTPAQESSCS
jgi:AcrR family transcriptional regulator